MKKTLYFCALFFIVSAPLAIGELSISMGGRGYPSASLGEEIGPWLAALAFIGVTCYFLFLVFRPRRKV